MATEVGETPVLVALTALAGTVPLTYNCPVEVPSVPTSTRVFTVSTVNALTPLEFCTWKAVVELVALLIIVWPFIVVAPLKVRLPEVSVVGAEPVPAIPVSLKVVLAVLPTKPVLLGVPALAVR
jgi:hypothetical protein